MTSTQTNMPITPLALPGAGGLVIPDFNKRHEPVVLPRTDGLTDEERWDLAFRGMEDFNPDNYDFDSWWRNRETERRQAEGEQRR